MSSAPLPPNPAAPADPAPVNLAPATLARVMEATWPPARSLTCGPFTLRDGQGGGKRVSAATLNGTGDGTGKSAWEEADIDRAAAGMQALGQDPLFMLTEADDALDRALEARGYAVIDPVVAYAAPVADLVRPLPPLAAFAHWPPLAVTTEIWAEGGIGPARLAVMARVGGPHTALLARSGPRAGSDGRADPEGEACSGACFVAISGNIAMLHALEVLPAQRRNGAGRHLLQAAAQWAMDQGAQSLSLVVTRENRPARALYESLGMQSVGQYHYRQRAAATDAPR